MTLQCTFAPFKSKYYLNAEHPLNRKFYFFFFFCKIDTTSSYIWSIKYEVI